MPNLWPIKSEKHSYGYNKDKYNPDAVYHLIKAVKLPVSTNNAVLAPPVKNQDGVGACGGFSWAQYFYCLIKQICGSVDPDGYSENWFYNLARWLEGTLATDAGLSNDDVLTMVAKFGILLEKYWPWVNDLDTTAPSSTRQAQAVKYPNYRGVRVDQGIDGIRSAMAMGHPVVLGGPFFQEWENAPNTGILAVPTLNSPIAGGHDTLWLDYDDTVKLFYCQNSWGESYGKAGRFYVPYDALHIMAQRGGYDCHYATCDPLPGPEPEPTPQPSGGLCHIAVLHQQLRAERGLSK